jgi:LuxR family maltose regulon positive regulatory protein
MSSRKLTLLSAPAGFGKTSLLATWTATTSDPVAWFGVDSGDGDPARFWSYAAEAVERARPGSGRRAARMLRARGSAMDVAVNELLADLERAAPVAIVLDDLHLVEDREALGLLGYAIEHLPAGVRIVASARADPPLALGRLRGLGLLAEMRAHDLAFTPKEARQLFLERMELDLGDEEVRLLLRRTEGWAVALYLAGLWLEDQDDPRARSREFAADNRYVIEYLTNEILEALDQDTRDFLVRTSVLRSFSAPLCDYVLERSDSEELLTELSRAGQLVLQVDRPGRWLRYHTLIRDLLRLELGRTDAELAFELHRRAATWFSEHDRPDDAVEHLLDARDPAGAAEILNGTWSSFLRKGDCLTLLRLAGRLPSETVLTYPELTAAAAQAAYLARRPANERARWLRLTDRSRDESPETWTLVAERGAAVARATAIDDGVGCAEREARRALAISGELGEWEVPALSALAYALYLSGSTGEAGEHASRAVSSPEAPRRPHGTLRALGMLALIAAEGGRTDEAHDRARAAIAASDRLGISASASCHIAHLALGVALASSGRLREAESAVKRAEQLCRAPDPSVAHAHAELVLGELQTQRGLVQKASASLRRAAREIKTFSDAGGLPRRLARANRQLRAAKASGVAGTEPLSPAELAVLRLLDTDLSQRGIGRRLFVSVNTIKTHTRNIYRKLGASSRAEAVTRARLLGLIGTDVSPG